MNDIWIEFNNNPYGRRVGDCAVRAVSVALGIEWDQAYALIAANGYRMGDMMASDSVWGSVLRQHGFVREIIPNNCPDCFTAADFARDHREGVFVLGFGGHVATVKDGRIYDSWDSSMEIPQYYWRRENGAV